jgi:hypothetical protein
VDGAGYTDLITLTASNTPTLTLVSTGVGSIDNMNIGVTTRGTGAFTSIDANSTVGLSPANANVTVSPSGTGTVTISPAGGLTISPTVVGTINNVNIGSTTRATGAFTTLDANGNVTLGDASADAININGTTLVNAPMTFTGSTSHLTLTGELRGPATFTIDPATVGDDTGTVIIRGALQVNGVNTADRLKNTAAPATSSSTGTAGDIRYASGFVYVCVATNTWQRAAIATW